MLSSGNLTHLSSASALDRAGPIPYPGSTVELAMVARRGLEGVWMSQPQADFPTSLPWGGTGAEMIPLPPFHYWHSFRAASQRLLSSGELDVPFTRCNTQESGMGSVLLLDSTAELTLVAGSTGKPALRVRVWEIWPWHSSAVSWPGCTGTSSGENGLYPSPAAELWRVGPSPLLVSTVVLALVQGEQASQSQEQSGRAKPTAHLL